MPPDRVAPRWMSPGRGDEGAAGGSSSSTVPRPPVTTDEFRDLALDLIAEIAALYDRAGYCECDDDHCNFDEVSRELVHLHEDAQHRLWVAELDGGRRG
jgi:hypothetical protein